MSSTTAKVSTKKDSRDIRADALKIANSIKIDGQNKADTKAIANGIQRGMEMFLRQQSEKSRDLDRRVKKIKQLAVNKPPVENVIVQVSQPPASRLPWVLLACSWCLFILLNAWAHGLFWH